ncbi:coenzyme F420-0:L-glutamate ligase [Bradyrhizobium canariense]|nr:coenzyme F420-0:L-glutamate ligase [Bradyrhizobium canariense]
MTNLSIAAVSGIPDVQAGTDLAKAIVQALKDNNLQLKHHDVLVVAQKIVSKSEGRFVNLNDVKPGEQALALAARCRKDPRLVQVILDQSNRVVRCAPDILIVEHKLGLVMANAGIDKSNIGVFPDAQMVLLLPEHPDRSAQQLRCELQKLVQQDLGIIINDSFGRPWRLGTVGVAIGAAGIDCTDDRRGEVDMFGRILETTVVGRADEIASAASLVMGQGSERIPVVLVRGLGPSQNVSPALSMVRKSAEDLFR